LVDTAKAHEPQPTPAVTPTQVPGDNAPAREPAPRPTISLPESVVVDNGASRYPLPRLRSVARFGRRLAVRVGNLPRGAQLSVLLQRRTGEFGFATIAKAHRSAGALSLRLPRRWHGGRLLLRFASPRRPDKTSAYLYRDLRE
jgi:hypothetical protein